MLSSKQDRLHVPARWAAFLDNVGPILFYVVLVALFTWPLLTQLGTHIPGTESDAFVHLWVFNWFGQALENGINPLYTDQLFFPVGVSLLNHNVAWFNIAAWFLLNPFVGLAPAYTLTLLLFLAFNGYALYLFVKDITESRRASLLAGVIGATWPFITTQLHHPNLIVIGFIPLTMRHLRRFILHKKRRDLVFTAVFICLLGSVRVQLLLIGLLLIGLYALYLLWQTKQLTSKKIWQQFGVAAVITAVGLSPFVLSILWYQLTRDNPGDLFAQDLFFEFTDLVHFLQPSPFHPLWGEAIMQLDSVPFHVPFLGYTVVGLALLALFTKKRSIIFWWGSALFFMFLALGPVLEVGGNRLFTMPHIWLYEQIIIPILRAPNRFNVLLPIPFAVLAALGYGWLESRLQNQWYRLGIWVLLIGLIWFEFAMVPFPGLPLSVPDWYQTVAQDSERYGLVEVPMDLQHEEKYMLYQITHGKAMVEGNVARPPREAYAFIRETPLLHHLDRVNPNLPPNEDMNISAQLEMLATADIRYIVLHRPFLTEAELETWQAWFLLPPYYEDAQVVVYQTDTTHLAETFADKPVVSEHLVLAGAKAVPAQTTQLGWVQIQTYWLVSDGFTEPENEICLALVDDKTNVQQTSCGHEVTDSPENGRFAEGLLRRTYQLQIDSTLADGSYQVAIYQPAAEAPPEQMVTAVPLTIEPFPRTFDPPTPTTPVDITFGDELALVGYDLAQAPTSLTLTLYWHARQKPAHSYKIFVHVVDEATGSVVAQQDYVPQNWQYPTNFWLADEYVTDQLTLDLTAVPSGTFHLQVGIYQPETGNRLLTSPTFPDNSARLTTLTH
ncbi:MAG: hypothetical protein CL608_02895 [Anaerolineaceae bacterium]|nr:hypothetical protein [Anaerolineaceae bacterium]